MKKNILFLVITICLIYCKDYRIEITSLTLNGVIQEPVYLYLTDIDSKVMSDILKDSSKVQMNFKIYDFCQGGYCEKSLSIELNDIQINESENDQIIAGDLFLSKAKSNHIIYLEFTLLGIQANTNYIRNKIGRVKNFEDLESLFNKTKTANNGNDISGDIRAQSYLEIIQFTINLAIKNCFGQDKCTDDYEIGVIANEEFYSLD